MENIDPRGRLEVLKYFCGDLNEYARHVHELNAIWWHDVEGNRLALDPGERYMLIISELAEAMEGHRKNLSDDKLSHYPMVWVELADTVIRVLDCAAAWGLELRSTPMSLLDEKPKTLAGRLFNIVDMICYAAAQRIQEQGEEAPREEGFALGSVVEQCVALAQQLGCPDFWQVVYEKLCYNQKRVDHSYEARALSGGKKF